MRFRYLKGHEQRIMFMDFYRSRRLGDVVTAFVCNMSVTWC